MIEVSVRYDLLGERKSLRIDGFAETYPAIGEHFVFFSRYGSTRIYIDLGEVVNISAYRNLLLVQTTFIVAEIWIRSGQIEDWEKVIPFSKSYKSSNQIGGKSTGRHLENAFSRLRSMIKDLTL